MKNFPFTMGADPEFNIIIQGHKLNAEKLFEKILDKKLKKETAEGLMNFKTPGGYIGVDGHEATAELRPLPHNHPAGLTDNIQKIFLAIKKQTQLFDFSTLSNAGAVGGHIHLSISDLEKFPQEKVQKILASFYVPLYFNEDTVSQKIRSTENYGKFDDSKIHTIHESDEKTIHTFEFRTPSAEWLTTPKITRATLAYIGTIYNEIMYHPENIKDCKEIIITSQAQAKALQELSMSSFAFLTDSLIKKIKENIKNFEFYKEHEKDILFILNHKKVREEKLKNNYNILHGWNIYDKPNVRKKEFASKKIVMAKKDNTDIELETKAQLIPITYNNDEFVEMFADMLKTKIALHNIKLNNEYFLYGIKSGIPNMVCADKNLDFYKGQEMISDKKDLQIITTPLKNMSQRFSPSPFSKGGTIKEINAKHIFVGLPYKMRTKMDFKPFLSLIYDLEKNRLKKQTLSPSSLKDYSPANPPSELQKNIEKATIASEKHNFNNVIADNSPKLDTNIRTELQASEDFSLDFLLNIF